VIDAALLEKLKTYDTPTICNALEIVDPGRRLTGFTVKPLVCPFPQLPPIVGYAKTATIRTTHAHELDAKKQREQRIAYYEYIAAKPAPGIMVIQDLDGADVGFGAFWGEVMSAVHKGLGLLGVVTDGSHSRHRPVGAGLPGAGGLGRAESCARALPTSARRCGLRACWRARAISCMRTGTAR
jgi:regulator of RNase E activity RraA